MENAVQDAATVSGTLIAEAFNSNFEFAHDTYNGMCTGSDGKVYYVLCSVSIDVGAQMYSYDPATHKINHLGDLTEACGEKGLKAVPQGNSHVQFCESNKSLLCHTRCVLQHRRRQRTDGSIAPLDTSPTRAGIFSRMTWQRAGLKTLRWDLRG